MARVILYSYDERKLIVQIHLEHHYGVHIILTGFYKYVVIHWIFAFDC